MSTDGPDARQAALDAESKRHALASDLELPNTGSAVDIQNIQLVSSSKLGCAVVHQGGKLSLSHGCTVQNSSGVSGHGIVAQPGSQLSLEAVVVEQCTGTGVVIKGGVAAKMMGVDISHCGEGGVTAAKGSTLSVDKCRIHQCCGGPGILAEAPASGGLVVRNCEIAYIRDAAGIEMRNAVQKVALKTAIGAVLLSARSQGRAAAAAASSEYPGATRQRATSEAAEPEETMSAAEVAAEAWLRDSGPSWRDPPPRLDDDEDDDNECGAWGKAEEGGEYPEANEVNPQFGMHPDAVRVVPYLSYDVDSEEEDAGEKLWDITNAVMMANTWRTVVLGGAEGGTGESDKGGDDGGTRTPGTESSKDTKGKKKKKNGKKETKAEKQRIAEEAAKVVAEERAVAEAEARLEWPIVTQCAIWGCLLGVDIRGKFDGTVRDNVIDLNISHGIQLSGDACGTVGKNRLHSNGGDGVTRKKLFNAGNGATQLAENYGSNWCLGATVECAAGKRLELLPRAWFPEKKVWRSGTEKVAGMRVVAVNRMRAGTRAVIGATVTNEWRDVGGGWRPEEELVSPMQHKQDQHLRAADAATLAGAAYT